MENKRKVYEVLEEKISPDNIVRIGELLALGALKYMCGHKMLHGMYADLARDIAYKDAEGYVLTESYDIVQEAAMFLCGYMGIRANESYTEVKSGETTLLPIQTVMRVLNEKFHICPHPLLTKRKKQTKSGSILFAYGYHIRNSYKPNSPT